MATLHSPPHFYLYLLCFFLLSALTQAQVLKSHQFRFVNQGPMSEQLGEFGATYREIPIANFPFRLCFYNTTPDAHIFAIGMGSPQGGNIVRWVWDANRRTPVRENSTLTFGRDGNLILADSNGHVVWEAYTYDIGVTGYRLLSNGNLVLHDKDGKFLWQSFDHPTDTLLVGQSVVGLQRLVSRTSDADSFLGPYSLAISPNGYNTFYNYSGVELPYGGWAWDEVIDSIVFLHQPYVVDGQTVAYYLSLSFLGRVNGVFRVVRLYYNAQYSFLRISSDGNLRMYTYNPQVSATEGAWWPTFSFFSGNYDSYPFWDFGYDRRCALPHKCGSFGLCQEGMCVACPLPGGMVGWSESCAPPELPPSCNGAPVGYYEIAGVDHFLSTTVLGEESLTEEECRDSCSADCQCAGFFYWRDTSQCWTTPLLGTLLKADNLSHVGHIKVPEASFGLASRKGFLWSS